MSFYQNEESPLLLNDSEKFNGLEIKDKFDIFQSSQKEFYQAFSSFRQFEYCNIDAFKLDESESGHYVTYVIHVKTRDVEYKIKRRYSEFHELYQEILKNHKGISICGFPEKKWFGNLEEKVIKERIIKLNEFLKQLVLNCQSFVIYEVLSFLAIDKCYEYFGYSLKTFSFDKIKVYASNQEDEKILDLLIKLNLNDTSLSKTVEEFENSLFEKKMIISNKIVQILLLGDLDLKGLMEIFGKVHEKSSHFTCNTGLKFLCSLMNHEKNPGAEQFIKVFVGCHLRQLGLLNLASHILLTPSKNCKNHALMLLKIYLDGNPNVNQYLIETILESEEAYLEFIKWKKTHQLISQKTEGYDIEYEGVYKKTSIIFEEINFYSATFKKTKSPLFHKRVVRVVSDSLFKKIGSEPLSGKKS